MNNQPFPEINISCDDDGVRIHQQVAPATVITTFLPTDIVDQLCKQWKVHKAKQVQEAGIIRNIMDHRL